MNKKEFDQKYGDYVKMISDLDMKENNTFTILGLTNYEIRHSNYLSWLLRKREFFIDFIEKCGLEGITVPEEMKGIRFLREEHFEEVDKDGNPVYAYKNNGKIICTIGEVNRKAAANKTIRYEFVGMEPKRIEDEDTTTTTQTANDEFEYYTVLYDEKNHKVIRRNVTRTDSGNDVFFTYTDLDGNKKKVKFSVSSKFKPIGRYIDLNIIGEDFTITIENKIDTGEHDLQCIAYKNYVENTYKGKKHFYIFLAKNEVENFDKDEDGLYPGYQLIYYKNDNENEDKNDIYSILDESKLKNDFEKDLLTQYKTTILNWKKMPEEYSKVFNDNIDHIDMEPIADNKKYYTMLNSSELSDEDKRFVELARQYYDKRKEEANKEIYGTLEKTVKKGFIEPYSGNYAYAILFDNKDNKKDTSIRTVDFRGPYKNFKYPSIFLLAGTSKERTQQLIKEIKESNVFDNIKPLLENKTDDRWKDVKLNCYTTNGSNMYKHHIEYKVEDNCCDKFKDLIGNNFLVDGKALSALDFADTRIYEALKELDDTLFIDSKGALLRSMLENYILKDEGKIGESLTNILNLMEKLNVKTEFTNYINSKKPHIFTDPDTVKNKIKETLAPQLDYKLDDKKFASLQCSVYIALFRAWIDESKNTLTLLKELNNNKDITELDKSVVTDELKGWIKNLLSINKNQSDEDNEQDGSEEKQADTKKKDKKSSILSLLIKAADIRNGKDIKIGWTFEMLYELKNQNYTEEIIKNKTLECIGVFGQEYKDYFNREILIKKK